MKHEVTAFGKHLPERMAVMTELTASDRRLCSLQGAVFESSLTESESGSAVFVRRFMNSNVAKRFDADALLFQEARAEKLVREVEGEFGDSPYGSARFSPNEMHWMGYLYRCLCCITGMPSKGMFRKVPSRELRKLYGPYHTLDPERAASEVMQLKDIRPVSDVQYGVEVLKRIRARAAANTAN